MNKKGMQATICCRIVAILPHLHLQSIVNFTDQKEMLLIKRRFEEQGGREREIEAGK